ncbi:hypothetical protein SAY87_015890 [Trapa incisa]|uniref:Uncharacterized protein n=1 Tax=Trapa incisa TaxID=236973 RepID=A0AAN7L895_9MYRT|nr:hypothetical protein SAY87_015890 [Trapa incisa]
MMKKVLCLKFLRRGTKTAMKKQSSAKIQRNSSVSDIKIQPIITNPLSSPTTPSSSVIPFLSPVYLREPPQFPDMEDCRGHRSPRAVVGGKNRSPERQRQRDPGHKRAISCSRKSPSPIKLVDPHTLLILTMPSPCVL